MTAEKVARSPIPESSFLSSGSALLNKACSGNVRGAFFKGGYFWIVGDSSSGKTLLTLTTLAEAANNPNFDDYDIIFDNAENGALMDIEEFFGEKLADRIEAPRLIGGVPCNSERIEDFYFNIDDRLLALEQGKKDARRFIYLLDSMDCLTSKYEEEKFKEAKAEARGGKKAKGDYGDGKAKINSRWIRKLSNRIRRAGCILIVLSQTRDNIDAGMFDESSVAAGGRALKFYAQFQLWLSVGERLTKEVNGTVRQTGITCWAKVKKNRLTGKEWTVDFPIYWSYGIDDIGSCVDFLVEEKRWAKTTDGKKIEATDIGFTGSRAAILKQIEDENLEQTLYGAVDATFDDIVLQCKVKRKKRYS